MHLTLSSVDHLQDVFKLFLANTLEKYQWVWMMVAEKETLENLVNVEYDHYDADYDDDDVGDCNDNARDGKGGL